MYPFFAMPWVGLLFGVVTFTGHAQFLETFYHIKLGKNLPSSIL